MAETISNEGSSSTETVTEQTTPPAPTPTDTTSASDFGADERAELERLRAIHKEESRWEKRAKANYNDAQKFRELIDALGGESKTPDFDPKSEFEKLRAEIEATNVERTRSEVARLKGVDPELLVGSTQEEMESAADRYLAAVEARVQAALKKATVPATESTSTVTSGDYVEGPKQITSEAELMKLTPQQQMAAYKEGRLDQLLGRR